MKTVIFVMNKSDLVREDELARIVSFATRVVAERPDTRVDPTIFPLSARAALDARSSADEKAFARSGLMELEAYLRDHLAARKQALLAASVGHKMLAILDSLQAEAALRRQALALPLDQLDFTLEALGAIRNRVRARARAPERRPSRRMVPHAVEAGSALRRGRRDNERRNRRALDQGGGYRRRARGCGGAFV